MSASRPRGFRCRASRSPAVADRARRRDFAAAPPRGEVRRHRASSSTRNVPVPRSSELRAVHPSRLAVRTPYNVEHAVPAAASASSGLPRVCRTPRRPARRPRADSIWGSPPRRRQERFCTSSTSRFAILARPAACGATAKHAGARARRQSASLLVASEALADAPAPRREPPLAPSRMPRTARAVNPCEQRVRPAVRRDCGSRADSSGRCCLRGARSRPARLCCRESVASEHHRSGRRRSKTQRCFMRVKSGHALRSRMTL